MDRQTHSAPGPARSDHRPVTDHRHHHDPWCGHPSLPHGDHEDFLHDGQVHHPCDDHVDDVGGLASGSHLPHSAHMHVHADECGHEVIRHGDHSDFLHGQHRHAVHDSHYDEH